ncbi:unnamed protein product [Closterium sp. NIES-53]
MGDVKYYLRMDVERDPDKGVLRLHQRKYCEGLAEKYGLQDQGKPATPLPSGFPVEPCADEEVVGESDRKLFHSMEGALNNAANHTRPDIAFATSRLASVVSRPSHEQLEAAKRLVRYVSATAFVGLEYSALRQRLQRGAADLSKGEMLLTCYTDASINSVKADGTSIGGYVCLFGGGAVSWRSKKQNEVGLSSCETEYMALHHGVKEVVWLRRLLEEIGVCQREPTVIERDQEGLSQNSKSTLNVAQHGSGALGAGARGAGVGETGAGAVAPGGTVRPRPYFVPLLHQVLGTPSSTGLTPPLLCAPPDQSLPLLLPASSLRAPSPYIEQSGSLTEHREHASRPVSHVRTAHRVPHSCLPHVPGTHARTLRPSSVPLCVPLPAPPASSLREVPNPESDRARAASPTVSRLLATAVTDPSFESAATSALVAELLDFAAACRLDYATALVAGFASASPPSIEGKCALGTDVLEDRQEDIECLAAAIPRFVSMLLAPEGDPDAPDIPTPRSCAEAITGPYSSQWQAAMDVELASWKSTGTYVDEVPPPGANIVDGMWIFRVKRPSGSPPVFKARYVARGFSQGQGRDYELHSLDFSIAFLQGSLHEEIWLRRPPCFNDSFPAGTQTTLAALGFAPATADPALFLRTDTSLPPFYVLVYVDDLVFATGDTEALTLVKSELQKRHTCTDLGELRSYLGLQITRDRARHTITLTKSHMVHHVHQRFSFQLSSPQPSPLSTSHSLSAPPSDETVEPSGPYPELVGCLMYLMTCTRPDLAYPLSLLAHYVAPGRHRKGPVVLTGHADTSWVDDSATQRSSQGYTFSLCSGSVFWRSTRSSSVLSSSCEAEIYAGAMAAQELRWLTYLLTDLGEQPRSPPVLTKHIALRYFLARELEQRGQLRLAYVATRANIADIFTKALPPGDHQRFSTVLGLLALLS